MSREIRKRKNRPTRRRRRKGKRRRKRNFLRLSCARREKKCEYERKKSKERKIIVLDFPYVGHPDLSKLNISTSIKRSNSIELMKINKTNNDKFVFFSSIQMKIEEFGYFSFFSKQFDAFDVQFFGRLSKTG